VKYDSELAAQWAKSTASPSTSAPSQFNGVAVDGSGVYAVGSQGNASNFNYGGAIALAPYNGNNSAIVKYDSATGAALFAKTTTIAPTTSYFFGVAADGQGHVYAVGYQRGAGIFNYGGSVTAQGNYSINNAVIVHYDSNLTAQWAASTTGAPAAASQFNGVATDGQGNVYAAGYQTNTGTFNYGGVSAKGSHTGYNAVVVHYHRATGSALWAKAATGGGAVSYFNGIAADASADSGGNFVAAGYQTGTGIFNYGGSVTAQGAAAGNNAVAARYK
jgi:hypothetical protein